LIKIQDPARVACDPVGVLREAHDRAVKASGIELPDVAAERRRKADEAKRLASINVRSSAGRSPRTVSGDIWSNDAWSAAYDRASGGR
jgi:hypothetical protein